MKGFSSLRRNQGFWPQNARRNARKVRKETQTLAPPQGQKTAMVRG
jgi:hypothetical protein